MERSWALSEAARLREWLAEKARWRVDGPTPVDTLARLLGLEIATFDAALHPGIWGYLEPGEDLIFLRAGLSEATRRFTLAHELGHVTLHRGRDGRHQRPGVEGSPSALPFDDASWDVCRGADVETFDLITDETLNPGQAYSARADVEQEANLFAVALLMPEAEFLGAYRTLWERRARPPALGAVTRALARRFKVSEDAALRRLQSFLEPAPVPADAPVAGAFTGAGDDSQQAAAHLDTPALVTAGPGSGKTATLVARVKYLVSERGVRPEEILALTFSRKAARELGERVAAALRVGEQTSAPTVSTIHRFCLDLLGRYGTEIGLTPDFRLAPDVESYFLVRDVMRREPLQRLAPPHAPDLYVRDVQQAISRAKDDLVTPDDLAREAVAALDNASDDAAHDSAVARADIAVVYHRYQRALADLGVVDYGDVITLCAGLLSERPEIAQEVARQWPHVLLDEYQDINRAMAALIERLVAAGSGLWAVGDADQAIYRFRGADPGIVSRFGATFAGASFGSLARNYRSTRPILIAAHAFARAFSQVDDRLGLEVARQGAFADGSSSPAVRLIVTDSGADEVAALARAIEERRQAGRAYRDHVALVRTRRQVEYLVEGLRERRIPVSRVSGALESEDVKPALAVVGLLGDASGAGLIRAGRMAEHTFTRDEAIAALDYIHHRRGDLVDTLRGPVTIPGVSAAGRAAQRQLGRALAALRAAPSVATGLCQYVFAFGDAGERALAQRDAGMGGDSTVRRLLEIARAFDAQWRPQHGRGSGADWSGFADYVSAVRLLRLDGIEAESRPESDTVRVMTVHASKGLEFPVVLLPQLVNRRFPLTSRASAAGKAGERGRQDSGDEGELSEEAALFYVAMTRARDELVFSRARMYGRQTYTPSPFLAPIERALGDELVTEYAWSQATAGEPAESRIEAAADADEAAEARSAKLEGEFELGELETYQRCPRQYAYRYVDGIWSPAPLSALFGRAAAHAARDLERAFSLSHARNAEPPSGEDAWRMVESRWREMAGDERVFDEEEDGGRSSLAQYYLRQARTTIEACRELLLRLGPAAWTASDDDSGDAEARHVSVDLGEIVVRGVVDASASRQGRSSSVDTPGAGERASSPSKARSRRNESRPALRDLFTEVAASQFEGVERPGYGGGRAPALTARISARQRERLTRDAVEAGAGIRRGDFRPLPDEWKCRRCPFAAACPD